MGFPESHTFLRADLTSQLVEELYGSYLKLALAWGDMADTFPTFPKPRQASAIHNWLKNGIPDLNNQLFAFCSLLDVDPLAILDYKRHGNFESFAKLRQLIYRSHVLLGGLAPIFRLIRPNDVWPSREIASECYHRPWSFYQLSNSANASSNDYILIKALFCQEAIRPRAVHIAYRRLGVPDTMWRPYGSVLAIHGTLHLHNESGDYQTMEQPLTDEVRFRTYYGGRPVEWRIASLHEFEGSEHFPFNDPKTIGFTW